MKTTIELSLFMMRSFIIVKMQMTLTCSSAKRTVECMLSAKFALIFSSVLGVEPVGAI